MPLLDTPMFEMSDTARATIAGAVTLVANALAVIAIMAAKEWRDRRRDERREAAESKRDERQQAHEAITEAAAKKIPELAAKVEEIHEATKSESFTAGAREGKALADAMKVDPHA